MPLLFPVQSDWQTTYERSHFLQTGRYQEAIDYCNRLAKASPLAKVIRYGTSPEGRPMIALLISKEKEFTAEKMRVSKRPTLFVQNGIHSGEIEGKDASLILAREMLITGKEKALLGANWVIVPVFSVDAHERSSPWNRINQNGPTEMGWRSTAQNYNLNRDWMKADALEMRHQLRLVHRFRPDFLFDNHTTDGSDYQYVLTLSVPDGPELPASTASWSRDLYKTVKVRADRDGFLTSPYFGGDPNRGLTVDTYTPRYSHGYWDAMNRPSMLVETHVLKAYRPRVEATYSAMKHVAEVCIQDADRLKKMNRDADLAAMAGNPHRVLTSKPGPTTSPFSYLGYEPAPYDSPISGAKVTTWDRTKPITIETTIRDIFVPDLAIDPPAAYAIPPAWIEVIDRVKLHDLQFRSLTKPYRSTFNVARFHDVKFAARPFEGRFQPTFTTTTSPEVVDLPAGTVIVPVAQRDGKLAMHLFEVGAPDSLLAWGLFNNIFEQKEYGEAYAIEPVARKMLESNPALKAEFESKLKDPEFATNPGARLNWFYQRSPYWDQALNRYPVVRLNASQLTAAR